ncbi:MAG: polyprenyl synthetase family protein [Bacteroidales bacterium]|jgi:geranylgeranyl diphosphate synthase type II|nr:polyprenyl synthetase family protein [Bacteroidales bacterium]
MKELSKIIDEKLSELNFAANKPHELYAPADYVLSLGGKHIRPLFTLLACKLFERDTKDNGENTALPQALGVEIFHNFTLLHDDVMDNASVRRGKPTVHIKWNTGTAILSGDAMLVLAYMQITNAPAEKLPTLLKSFNYTALGVCEGQQYDMNFETKTEVTLSEYMEMIRLKTAVLIAGALDLGAIMGGATENERAVLREYGTNIGLAFQLQDDLLDLYADEKTFGKKIGSDITEKKKTYLYIKALELLQEQNCTQERALLINALQQSDVSTIKTLYGKINVKTCCQKEIENYYGTALAALSELPNNNAKKEIETLTETLLNRNR